MKFPRWLLIPIVLILLCFAAAVLLMCTSPGVPVLNYHQVEDKDGNPLTLYCDQFDQQMAYLAEEGYHTITLDEMMDAAESGAPLPAKPVVITLDDGYVDNYEYAYPILKKYGFKATIFLINDFTGVYPNYLTWEQIHEMQDSGLINFESHTMTHANLSELTSRDELRHEIADSHRALREAGQRDQLHCLPGRTRHGRGGRGHTRCGLSRRIHRSLRTIHPHRGRLPDGSHPHLRMQHAYNDAL